MKHGFGRTIALAAPLLAVAMALAISLSYNAVKSPGFCVSCHLPSDSSKPLHQKKMEMMISDKPLSLAGVHYKSEKSALGCLECHHGANLSEKMGIFWFQIKNTFLYFIGNYEEPKTLTSPVSDKFCSSCHGGMRAKAVSPNYHSMMSHDGLKEITCVKCHTLHTPPAPGGGFLDKKKVLTACALCHKNPAQSEILQKSLGVRANKAH
ncbi:hypothetical protein MNBD_NITROSPINAE04-140 [hydrothermal vent metagenome]|uniref:Tetrahaem cytochrome domain-containing protein n=1 Tax=hydrothermal vent metagenome TaxID=652676 RepID=A0A3B1C090_9ZZZZ